MRDYPRRTMYMVGCDQKMEENTWAMIKQKPTMYQKWVMIRDLLHVEMWMVAALWQLCGGTVLYQFVVWMKFDKLGKAKRFDYWEFKVEEFNYYSSYTLAWIDGVMQYFVEVAGVTRVGDYHSMTDAMEDNKGMLALYTTLCLMLHYSELVREVQGCNHAAIKRMGPSLYHILQASNHYKVAGMLLPHL